MENEGDIENTGNKQESKWRVPRGKAATAAKRKYRDANYDRIEINIPKVVKK